MSDSVSLFKKDFPNEPFTLVPRLAALPFPCSFMLRGNKVLLMHDAGGSWSVFLLDENSSYRKLEAVGTSPRAALERAHKNLLEAGKKELAAYHSANRVCWLIGSLVEKLPTDTDPRDPPCVPDTTPSDQCISLSPAAAAQLQEEIAEWKKHGCTVVVVRDPCSMADADNYKKWCIRLGIHGVLHIPKEVIAHAMLQRRVPGAWQHGVLLRGPDGMRWCECHRDVSLQGLRELYTHRNALGPWTARALYDAGWGVDYMVML